MKINFTHASDIHIGNYQGSIEVGGLNSRFVDFVKTFDEMIDYTVKQSCDFCLITGDIFKNKDPQPIEVTAFVSGLRKLMENKIPVYIILGNHDLFLHKKLKHSIAFLEELKLENVHISSEPEMIYFNTKHGERVCIQTMPYQHRELLDVKTHEEVKIFIENKINEQYNSKEKGVPCIFAGHFSITDAKTGTEQQSINKFNEPIVSKDVFLNKKYVYGAMGHLHRHQVMLENPPIVYGGSLNRIDFNEWAEKKGFIFCQFDKKFVYEFIEVSAKRFVNLEYNMINVENPEEYVLADLEKRKEELKDSVIKISVELSENNKNKYSQLVITDFINSQGSYIQGNTSPHIAKNDKIIEIEYTELMDSIDVMKKYCENNDKIENKKMFIILAEEIIKETNNINKERKNEQIRLC